MERRGRRDEAGETGERANTGPTTGTRKEARVALLTPVNNVLSPDEQANQEEFGAGEPGEVAVEAGLSPAARTTEHTEENTTEHTTEHTTARPADLSDLRHLSHQRGTTEPTPLRLAIPWVAALSVFVLIATVLLLVANNQTAHAPGETTSGTSAPPISTSIAHVDLAPAAQAAGVATAHLLPTARPEYHLFVDGPDGFLMQYPTGWDATATSPGARFSDITSDQVPLYWVQVDLPDPWALSDAGLAPQPTPVGTPTSAEVNAALAQSWVTYVMHNLASLYPDDDFIANPTPSDMLTVGGGQWAYGSALISTRNVEVEVMATIYNGQPYIISLYGADGGFVAGQSLYFNSMLQTFTFLAPPQAAQRP